MRVRVPSTLQNFLEVMLKEDRRKTVNLVTGIGRWFESAHFHNRCRISALVHQTLTLKG